MKQLLLAMMILGCAHALTAQTEPAEEDSPFQPAETISVTDLSISLFSVANGTVVLDALISDAGKVDGVEVRRDIDSITQPAVSAVEEWKFSPATFEGNAIASRMPVAVTVRPSLFQVDQIPLPKLKPQTEAAIQAEFQSAQVTRAAFPGLPENNMAANVTVMLEVSLSATGKVGDVKVLRDVPPYTDDAKAVLGDWRFMPATFNGQPVPSKIVLVFVLRPPAVYFPSPL